MSLSKTPLYLKDENFVKRPTDPEYFLVAANGVFLCHNTKFFQADVRVWGSKLHWERPQRFWSEWAREEEAKRLEAERTTAKYIDCLQPHEEGVVKSLFPPLKAKHVQKIVGFFDWVYQKHHAESIVVLYWDLKNKRYHYYCPPQKVSSVDLAYPPMPTFSGQGVEQEHKLGTVKLPPMCTLVGTFHSHCDMDTGYSFTDEKDEKYTDGLHLICGHLNSKVPSFAACLIVEGRRFEVKDAFMEDFVAIDEAFPKSWTKQVSVQKWLGWWGGKKGKKSKQMGFVAGNVTTADEEEDAETAGGGANIVDFDNESDVQPPPSLF